MAEEEMRRKFINPTPMFVGAVIYDEDGKRKGVPVEPGGSIWLSPKEERATAEAPVQAADNPFVAAWDEVTGHDAAGEPVTVRREGMLVLSDEPARAIASERFIPGQQGAETPAPAAEAPPEPEPEEEIVGSPGAPPEPQTPPETGTPGENEIVATPEAVPANDAEKEARAAGDAPTPVTDRPQGTEAIGTPPTHHPLPV